MSTKQLKIISILILLVSLCLSSIIYFYSKNHLDNSRIPNRVTQRMDNELWDKYAKRWREATIEYEKTKRNVIIILVLGFTTSGYLFYYSNSRNEKT